MLTPDRGDLIAAALIYVFFGFWRKQMPFKPLLAAAVTTLGLGSPAYAIPFLSNSARAQTSVTALGVNQSNSQETSSDQDPDVFVQSVRTNSPGLNAADISSALSEPDASRLAFTSLSRVQLERADLTDPSAVGNADLEPSQFFTFAAPGSSLRLDLEAIGVVDITQEAGGNNSTARFDVRIVNQTTREELFREFDRSPSGYSVTRIVDFEVTPGDVLEVSIDNSTFGFIGGQEIEANVTSTLDLTFTVIPEPASITILGLGGLMLGRRRSRPTPV